MTVALVSGAMGTLERVYTRLGPRYLDAYLFAYVVPAMVLGAAAASCFGIYHDVSLGEAVRIVLVSEAILAVSLVLSATAIHRSLAPTREWIARGGGPQGARRAWRRAVRTPVAVLPAKLAGGTLLVAVPIAAYAHLDFDLDGPATLTVFLAVMTAFAYHLLLSVFGAEVFLRPVVEHIARHLDDTQLGGRPTLSLRRRLLVSLPLIAGMSAILVSVATEESDATFSTLGTEFAVTIVVVGLTALPLVVIVVRAILMPVRSLLQATQQLRAGDLSARVPVLHEDELGMLTATFNGMAAELQESREQLVAAREEERRRLRRDLHDGLGPSLAAVTMRLDIADGLLEARNGDRPATHGVREEIAAAQEDLRDAIADIRRLVDDLRPPRLDELGLAGAIQERVARLPHGEGGRSPRVALEMQPPAGLGELPAAVEVAAYRIVEEALENARRHSGAASCTVRLVLDEGLQVEVRDDGHGLPAERRAGVGLDSMRERAAEVGGVCRIDTWPGGGVRVSAHLPVRR
jgi:signal transduction histidine kinase